MSDKIIVEVSAGLQCSATLITLRDQLESATRQIADLKRQLEEKK